MTWMRFFAALIAAGLVAGFAPLAAGSSTTQVFSTTGSVTLSYCGLCHWAADHTIGDDVSLPDGYEEDVVAGALHNGGNYFTLSMTSATGVNPDVSITFYRADGFVAGHFGHGGGEQGTIPTGADTAVVRLDSGIKITYQYKEFIVRG